MGKRLLVHRHQRNQLCTYLKIHFQYSVHIQRTLLGGQAGHDCPRLLTGTVINNKGSYFIVHHFVFFSFSLLSRVMSNFSNRAILFPPPKRPRGGAITPIRVITAIYGNHLTEDWMTSLSVESLFRMNHRMNNFKRITKTGSILYFDEKFKLLVHWDTAKTIIVYSKMHTFWKMHSFHAGGIFGQQNWILKLPPNRFLFQGQTKTGNGITNRSTWRWFLVNNLLF